MTPDPRAVVLVGAGQLSQRVDRGEPELEPVDLIAETARRAAADTGVDAGRVLAAIDSIRLVSMLSWRYIDPGRLVAPRIGASPRESVYTTGGGQTPQSLVNATALDIAAGRADLVLIAGAEAWRTRMRYRADDNAKPPWTVEDQNTPPAESFGGALDMNHPAEMARGLMLPVQMYPIFETALRAAAGRTVAEHQRHLGAFWSGFSAVATTNPHAWIRDTFTGEEIATPGPENRMIGFPYPKLMNSNNAVEQSAAILMCSVERASELGVPADRWVFPLAGADARDAVSVSNRRDMRTSPAIGAVGRAVYAATGIGPDDVTHADLYSCFPSAVQVAAAELGLALDRPLTVTGGLSFAGGPWNDYVTHAIAAMVGVLRNDAGAVGLCSANGGFLTKHSVGLYSTTPPDGGFKWSQPQAEVDAVAGRELADDHVGDVTVEGYVVMHDRDGEPQTAIAALLTPAGARTWGTSNDAVAMKSMLDDEYVGRPATLDDQGTLSI